MQPNTPSGLACYGDLQWGNHLCHLYETRDDLIEALVPFFAAGLANNEKCLWIAAPPLPAKEAAAELTRRVPDLAAYRDKGQIQIVDYGDWYTSSSGRLRADSLLAAWATAEQQALADGYTGLRATGNITFLKSRESWRAFQGYEACVSEAFAGRRILALCCYQLGTAAGTDVLDIIRNHQFAVARRAGEWKVITERTAELREALAAVERRSRDLEAALRSCAETERRLQAELGDAQLLRTMSAEMASEDRIEALYQKLLDAASAVMRSDFASMQRFDRERGALELLSYRGFSAEAARHWAWVRPDADCSCGRALKSRSRVVVPDVEVGELAATGQDLAMFRGLGIRATQTTPLLSRSGELVGMLSTHWSRRHEPSERELRILDILARQVADLIERKQAIEALRARTEALIEADRHKDEFLATLAHELRNPLAPIRTGLAVLRARKSDTPGRVVTMMERQLGHMVRLIDDLLDVSRVSRGKVTLRKERVSLRAIVDSAIETSRPLIETARHRFDVTIPGTPVWLDVDATRIAQVVSNVLNNAAKYTPDGGLIRLVAETSGDSVIVRVSDTGIGIAPEMLPKVFDLFAQLDHSVERAGGGLGIGLSLAKMLAEIHGGSMAAESAGPGQGSTFTIRIPLPADRAVETAFAASDEAETGAAASRRVLVVDDNVDAAEMLALLLEDAGHTTHVVVDSRVAVDEAVRFRPDVVFLDIGMPQLSGFDVARLIRLQPAVERAVLVAVTGWGTDDDRQRCRAAGFDHHLTKPVVPNALTDLLAQLPGQEGAG
jgi:signal transduction histidine kinase/ActR/RegA family two-component response regulator